MNHGYDVYDSKTVSTLAKCFWGTGQGGRDENQDACIVVDTPRGMLAVVCDGMGGGPAGKEASRMAVAAIYSYVIHAENESATPDEASPTILKEAVEQAHQAILSAGEEDPQKRGMGSTVVALLLCKEAAYVVHVGDSRCYQFRHGSKVFCTDDHSRVNELLRKNEIDKKQALVFKQKNIITRALGASTDHEPQLDILPYEKGDRFLLCTDGIWGAMNEKELLAIMAKTPSLQGTADGLLLTANSNGISRGGKHDNMTLAIIQVTKDSTTKTKMNRKARLIIYSLATLCAISLLLNLVLAVTWGTRSDIKSVVSEKDAIIAKLQQEKESLQDRLNKQAALPKVDNITNDIKDDDTGDESNEGKNIPETSDAEKVIEEVITILQKASEEPSGEKRKPLVEEAKRRLNTLADNSKLPSALRRKISQSSENLSNGIVTQDEKPNKKVKGHLNSIINMLKK